MRILFVLLVISLASCSNSKKFTRTDLYFGLSKPNGEMVADSAFEGFMNREVTKVLSNGFTVYISKGYWVDENTHQLLHEPSLVINSVNKMNKRLSGNIDTLREVYKRDFKQQNLGYTLQIRHNEL